jgi:hypothetical protein
MTASNFDVQIFVASTFVSYCEMMDASTVQVVRVDGITTCVGVSGWRLGDLLVDAVDNRELVELEVAVIGHEPASVFFDFSSGINCMTTGRDPDFLMRPIERYIRDVLSTVGVELPRKATQRGEGIRSHGVYRD